LRRYLTLFKIQEQIRRIQGKVLIYIARKRGIMLKSTTLFCAILNCLLTTPNLSWAWSGKVIGIADGDTITVLRDKEQVRIRLYGIDCPERGQAFGNKAKQFTAKLVHGKVVEWNLLMWTGTAEQ
jgi:endonuclease YncB( thermonuclease family)